MVPVIGSKSSALKVIRIDQAVPADHVERMMGQGVARQPAAVLDRGPVTSSSRSMTSVSLGPCRSRSLKRGAEAELAVGIEIARRQVTLLAASITSRSGSIAGSKSSR